MFLISMRSNKGVFTAKAHDPETGFQRTQDFNSSDEAFDTLKEWEIESNKLAEAPNAATAA